MFQMTKRRNYRYVDSGYSQDVYIYTYIYITYVYNGEGYHGFLKDISVKKSVRLTGGGRYRMRKSFSQYRLDCFAPKCFNSRQVDT